MFSHRIGIALIISLMLLAGTAATPWPNGRLSAAGPTTALAGEVPSGFTDTLVTTVTQPTALAFTPDGRMLIAGKLGRLLIYQNGALLTSPALFLDTLICNNRERGFLGLTVDPAFASNRFIYVYYTHKKYGSCPSREVGNPENPVNRVSRFTLPDSNKINLASEFVLVDNIPSPTGGHNAGDIHFGADGLLYISTGDGECQLDDATRCGNQNDNARRLDQLAGKILRIAPDGSIPDGNPYKNSADARRCGAITPTPGSGPCQEIIAHGLRNPFRFTFKSGTNTFYINDVGLNRWEEIDLGQVGADYGWNIREGHCATGSSTNCGPPPAGMTNPIYDYGHDGECASITGGVFVPEGIWPAEYDGAYLFGDYVCGTIFRLVPAGGGGYTATPFVSGLGTNSLLMMTAGPDGAGQAIYYTTFGGEVRKITYTASTNRPPIAVASAEPTSGRVPLRVAFDGTGSSDPDGDELTYDWDFGDGSAHSSSRRPSHTYQTTGIYTATLIVSDEDGANSTPATIRIDAGNTAPSPQIIAQAPNPGFSVGQTIILQGFATDAEDGILDGTRLTWSVLLHHNEHTHPYLPPTVGGIVEITAPEPEDLEAAQTSYLEVELAATDHLGLTTVITQALQPHRVNVSFATEPPGLSLEINETTIGAPRELVSWEGYVLHVYAPPQEDAAGQHMMFRAWSDGDTGAVRTITTPAEQAAYTAIFGRAYAFMLPVVAR